MIDEIKGTIVIHDGTEVNFTMSPDNGWHQFGVSGETMIELGTSEMLSDLEQVCREHANIGGPDPEDENS